MSEEFEINDGGSSFDIKGFLFSILRYWPLYVISLAIGFGIAYYKNVRMVPVYRMSNMITIKDDQNPFFTNNTSLTFNWGGTTDKVNTAIISLESRSHNEKVVETLDYYVNYLKEGEYQKIDAYKQTPFFVESDPSKYQILNELIKISFTDSVSFDLSLAIGTAGSLALQRYDTKDITRRYFEAGMQSYSFKIGEKIDLPFFNGTILPNPEMSVSVPSEYFFKFSNFDAAVKEYLKINVVPETQGSSVLKLNLTGENKALLVDYLNTSVSVLSEDMLDRKNLFATKTIRFIDSSMSSKAEELTDVEQELNQFRDRNAIFDLESEGVEITQKLSVLDQQKEAIERELNYYDVLEEYLINRTNYSNVPAPSVAGISEVSITSGVARIITLAEERNRLQYSFKEGAPVFDDIDRRINAVKDVLLENIKSSTGIKRQELASINREIARNEGEIRKLPKEQQELLKIERRYNLSQGTYSLFLQKRSEAGLVKAANVSDVQIIDIAKDTGGGRIGPNTKLNYLIALVLGLLLPSIFIFLKMFFDTKIRTVQDLESITKIPVLGVIGKSRSKGNLAVIDKPKSAIAESFRAIRSSLQFFYKKQGVVGAKTLLVTSSVSGEGKTFTSINIASVFALSNKKTVLVGLDLRKPKIFGDFAIDNSSGVVNYLINDATLSSIVQQTKVPNLDIITSGPIPPNPSELLMSERMSELIDELKTNYDYVILDSPPLGLVADSLELIKFSDAVIYMVRQNYTKKGMLGLINDKYKKGEIKNLSVLLNYFEDKGKYGYGYGYGYNYGYGYGYGAYGNGYHEEEKSTSWFSKFSRIFRQR